MRHTAFLCLHIQKERDSATHSVVMHMRGMPVPRQSSTLSINCIYPKKTETNAKSYEHAWQLKQKNWGSQRLRNSRIMMGQNLHLISM